MNKLYYSPHPKAPLFEQEDFSLLIEQAVNEIQGGSFSTTNQTIRELFRQAGFVNLWFFLKFICGYNGPFDKLNNKLHVDMANFRQAMMVPGRKAACYTSRGVYKTTINTVGGNIFILLRNPDYSIGLYSCVKERSSEFLHITQRVFDSNEFFAWLYPEYVITPGVGRNNSTMMELPNRSRYFTEPSLHPHGVGCSTAGLHDDHNAIDDPIGDTQLNAERDANMEMEKIHNWLRTNIEGEILLRKGGRLNTIFYTATRYGANDAHRFMFTNIKKKYGYWKDIEDVEEEAEGQWHIYNRSIIEDGKVIFPEAFDKKKLEKMRKDDPWTYYTQMENNTARSGLNELNEYKVKECELCYEQGMGWYVRFFCQGLEVTESLQYCDMVITCDPGATVGRKTSKTSKSAVGVLAHSSTNRRYILDVKDGYSKPSTVFDWAFGFVKRFYDYFRRTVLEAQGSFKVLGPVWRDYLKVKNKEAMENNEPVYSMRLHPVSKVGQKTAVIRNTLEPILKEGLLYADKRVKDKVQMAVKTFPFGTLDVLDMITLGVKSAIRPLSERERIARKKQEDRFKKRYANVAGC